MRVLLTGATGFVGLNIVQALLRHGHEPICLLRPNARRKWLDRMGVRCEVAEFDYHAGLESAFREAEAVIHTAGNTSCHWRDIKTLALTNIGSTRTVLDLARRHGIRRIVYTSTTSTIGNSGRRERPADESMPLAGFRARSPYGITKHQAEQLLLAGGHGVETIILNPAEVIGPFDHTLQWGRIVLAMAHDRLPFLPPGSSCFSPAQDVADAHVAALTRGKPGQRYILGGHNVPIVDFIDQVGRELGCPVRPRENLPYRLLTLKAHARTWLKPLFGEPPVDTYRMRVFGGHYLFDDRRARQDLGYAPRPLRQAIAECVAWYRENGFLPAPAAQNKELTPA